jgi:type I restriction enzyme S subunit
MRKFAFMEKLLDGVAVEWKALGEVAEIYGGLTGKSKSDFEGGNAKYITYKNIFANIDVDFNALQLVKVSDSENQHEVKYGDVLFTGSSETADEAGMSSSVTTRFEDPVYLNSFSFGVRFNKDAPLIPEFSKYLFRSHFMRSEIEKTASGVTRFNI